MRWTTSVHGYRAAALALALAVPCSGVACIALLGDLEPTGGGTGGGTTGHTASSHASVTSTTSSATGAGGTGGGPCVDPGWGPGDVTKCGGLIPTQDQICKVDTSAGCAARCAGANLLSACGALCTGEGTNAPSTV